MPVFTMSPELLEIRRRAGEALLLGVRAALASCAAVAIAQSLHLTYPLYAVVAAVIVTDVSSDKTQKSGVQRLLGTAVGALAGAAVCAMAWAIRSLLSEWRLRH